MRLIGGGGAVGETRCGSLPVWAVAGLAVRGVRRGLAVGMRTVLSGAGPLCWFGWMFCGCSGLGGWGRGVGGGSVVCLEAGLDGLFADVEPFGHPVHGDPRGAAGDQHGGDLGGGLGAGLADGLVGVPRLSETVVDVAVVWGLLGAHTGPPGVVLPGMVTTTACAYLTCPTSLVYSISLGYSTSIVYQG